MKKAALLLLMALTAVLCFSQEITFKGETTWSEGSLYRIQVGAYSVPRNAELAFIRLKNAGLDPQYGDFRNLKRVMLCRVRAREIPVIVAAIRDTGFNEVWITGETALSEKWEIDSPDSKYVSFEFNDSNNYIVVENSKEERKGPVHFGDYTIQDKNIIELIKLGLLKIESSDGNEIAFSFKEEGDNREIHYEAVKAAPVSDTQKTGLFSRVWKCISLNGEAVEGGSSYDSTFLFSRAGTYLVTYADGTSAMAQWRWKDSDETDFQYSWEQWSDYGDCVVEILTPLQMVILDSTYGGTIQIPERLGLVPVY